MTDILIALTSYFLGCLSIALYLRNRAHVHFDALTGILTLDNRRDMDAFLSWFRLYIDRRAPDIEVTNYAEVSMNPKWPSLVPVLALGILMMCLGSSRVSADATGWNPDMVHTAIAQASATHGVSATWMERVIDCETGHTYRTDLVGAAGEIGPAQFKPETFAWLAGLSGLGGSVYNPSDNIALAAWAHAQGFAYLWSCG